MSPIFISDMLKIFKRQLSKCVLKILFNSKPLMTAGNIYKIYLFWDKIQYSKYNILSYFRRKWYM